VCHLDKPPDEGERRARAIFKYHVDVLDAQSGEIGWAVQLRVQANNETNVAGGEVDEDIFEWERQLGRANFGDGGGESVVLGGVHRNGRNRLMLRRGESKEVGGDPVEVTHVDSFKLLISAFQSAQGMSCRTKTKGQIILFKVEVTESTQTLLLGLPNTIHDILDVQDKVGLAVSGITEGHVRGVGLRNRS
jgi:hypothetical protein